MTRSMLLATSALSLLAVPAFADGMLPGGKTFVGLGDIGYDYNSLDFDGGSSNDLDVSQYHFNGAGVWSWPNGWNVQGNFGFNSDRLENDGGEEATIDTWNAGVGAFFRERERPEYMIGAQVRYQSLDIGDFIDGWGLTGFGEYYLPNITLGGAVGYSNFKRMGIDIDGWNFAAQGSYYLDPNVALRLNYQRANADFDGNDLNDWSLNGEVEYQIPDCTTAIYAGLGYGGWDDYGNDYDSWRFGLGLRFRLGEIAPLVERNRDEPTQLITLVRPHLIY